MARWTGSAWGRANVSVDMGVSLGLGITPDSDKGDQGRRYWLTWSDQPLKIPKLSTSAPGEGWSAEDTKVARPVGGQEGSQPRAKHRNPHTVFIPFLVTKY